MIALEPTKARLEVTGAAGSWDKSGVGGNVIRNNGSGELVGIALEPTKARLEVTGAVGLGIKAESAAT